MNIVRDDLTNPIVAALLNEHLGDMTKHSPPESIHALDLEALRKPNVTFWTVWNDSELLGCGALQLLDSRHGEIKSMRTARAHLRKGVGSAMLGHVIEEAVSRSISRVSLETGSGSAFAPAHALYEKFGFEYCEPFGTYKPDPFSRFMTLEL